MKVLKGQFAMALLLASWAAAQSAGSRGIVAQIEDMRIAAKDGAVRVEILLTIPAQPFVQTATNPDRVIIDLPNTAAGGKWRHTSVNSSGVHDVRVAMHAVNPPATRVVIDLDQAEPYVLHTEGNRVVLSLTSSTKLSAGRGAASAAASGKIPGIFHRRPEDQAPVVGVNPPAGVPPVAQMSPGAVRQNPGQGQTASSAPVSQPSAAHPDRGSLQEGTVFPSLGSPGTGQVAQATNSAPGSGFPAAQSNTAGSATTNATGSANPASFPSAVGTSSSNTAPVGVVSSEKLQPAIPVAPKPQSSLPSAVVSSAAQPPAVDSSLEATKPTTADASQTSPASSVARAPEKNALGSSSSAVKISGAEPAPQEPSAIGTKESDQSHAQVSTEDAAATPTDTTATLQSLDPGLRTVFKVKYVVEGVAYLDGGRSSGLAEGMKLEIKETDLPASQGAAADPKDPRVVAELEVSAIAETSAATEIHHPERPVKPGDLAYLSLEDAQALIQQRTLSATRKYPIVVAFSEGEPLDEEVRAEVPRPPSPAVNRAQGRIGVDYLTTIGHGAAGLTSSNLGLVMRLDITRINGTFWNVSGYWRGRLTTQSSSTQPTIQDLINRTYHLGMFYDNPSSPWVAGFGRLYLPWAPSLDTIDGGYFGRKLSQGATAGIFAGSTPDPTSWNYNPDQKIAGAFINFQRGSYDDFHYSSTSGLGLIALQWQINRPFVFFENSFSYKRYVSVYDSLQFDSPRGNTVAHAPGMGPSRNFLTIRWQVHPRVELDLNHTYFRDIPTFDPALVGISGALDKYLFQGFSAGARVEVLKQVFLYTDLGLSNRTGDAKNSLNQMYGLTFNHLPWVGLRADFHYSRFNSSFADGTYRSFSLLKNLNDNVRLELLLGDQNFVSSLTTNNRTRFGTVNFETNLGPHYFLQGGFTIDRGQSLNYDQWMFTLGYRFDSRRKQQ